MAEKLYDHGGELPVHKGSIAMVVLDMQEYFRGTGKNIISNVASVMEECNKQRVPVFLTQHGHKDIHSEKDGGSLARWWGTGTTDYVKYDSNDWMLMPEICAPKSHRENRGSNHYIDYNGTFLIDDKSRYDAFEGTHLQEYLKERNIKTVAIAGVMTNLCCETTARSAFVKDYDVIFLSDGTATASEAMHQATLLNLSFGFARIFSCNNFVKLLRKLK